MTKLTYSFRFILLAHFLCFCTSIFLSCGKQKVDPRLERVEEIIFEDFETALSILETIDLKALNQKQDRALYALLYTMALDKNHLEPKDEALIAGATDYYTDIDDKPHLMKALYYQGRVSYINENYASSLLSYFKAKEVAEKESDFFWAGMSCRGISDIYNKTYNHAEELAYAKKEYDYIKKSRMQPYLNYSLIDLARAHLNNQNYKEAMPILKNAIDSSIIYSDRDLYFDALKYEAQKLVNNEEYDNAFPILSEIIESGYSETSDSLQMCIILANYGETDKAKQLLTLISDNDPYLKSYTLSTIYKKEGMYKEALEESENYDDLTTFLFLNAVSHNLSDVVIDYLDIHKKLVETKLKTSRQTVYIIILVSIIIIGVLLLISAKKLKSHKTALEKKVIIVEQLQEMLDKSHKDISQNREAIKTIMTSKYKFLEDMSQIYFQSKNEALTKKKLAESVSELINEFSYRSEKIIELEKEVDSTHNNLMTDFRNDLPNLKEVDYRLFLLSVVGFSSSSLSLFLKEEKIEAVYSRKRRLKNKIKLLEETSKGRYIYWLS